MFFTSEPFSNADKQRIIDAICDAEKMTSGEIRLHTEAVCDTDVVERAFRVFRTLKMDETAQRNGVLIYVAYRDKKFAIWGDEGIHAAVPANFWNETKDKMQQHFQKGELLEAVLLGIREAGEKLQEFFPYEREDKNELTNEISEA